ncbi:MAG: hypothetical protein R3F07_18920 [Opitutaceae bacterium]
MPETALLPLAPIRQAVLRIGAAVILLTAGPVAIGAPAIRFDGLGDFSRPITTDSPEAQDFFDQGMNLLFGFNHGAAIRAFKEAARLDPGCAMAHWGIALANGPHINLPLMFPPMVEEAWAELQLALKYAPQATPVEQALIEALSHRYAYPQPEDRTALDLAYADAMRKVWEAYPDDADVGAFYAEALMDLRPWDQWTPEGLPEPGTDEILATLDAVLELNVNHPFANHLYIHAVEASPNPERALPMADRLGGLQPGLAHNVHMPSHVYIRVGRWQDAVDMNVKAVAADDRRRAAAGPPQGFIILYAAHNRHMLAYAAMMTGQSELAISEIREMVDEIPAEFFEEWATVAEGFAAMPDEVLVRFGRWDDILEQSDEFPDYMALTKAFRHAARGIALAAKGDPAAARIEQLKYVERAGLVPEEETFGNNKATAILAVITPMLEGEILIREGHLDKGLAALRDAVAAEDALAYDEPPGWILPVRHSLGATLMANGRYKEAEQVYRDDLERLPSNGWSLFGLAESLFQQDRRTESAEVMAEFSHVWAKADVAIESSCFCQPGI